MTKIIKIFGVELENLPQTKRLKISVVDDETAERCTTILGKTEVEELLEELCDWLETMSDAWEKE